MAWITRTSTEQYEREQRQYTKSELRANWWHYHKWIVLIAVFAVAAIVGIIFVQTAEAKPDYQVGVVALQELPVDTSEALAEQLATLGTDLNGDGVVLVQINQYTVDFNAAAEGTDAYSQMAGVTRLGAELQSGTECYIFLLEDAQAFETNTAALEYRDGTRPEEGEIGDWQKMCVRWADCPVLTALDLGRYRGYTLMDTQEGEGQDVLADFYLAHRGDWGETPSEGYRSSLSLWEAMTADAKTSE